MTTVLAWLVVLIVGVALAWVLVALLGARDPYPPEAAEAPEREPAESESVWSQLRRALARQDWNAVNVSDPVDEHFNTTPRPVPYVKSDHPLDCADRCCREIRGAELDKRFDWHAYEYEMRKTK